MNVGVCLCMCVRGCASGFLCWVLCVSVAACLCVCVCVYICVCVCFGLSLVIDVHLPVSLYVKTKKNKC